jgi:hypothetical protein
MSDNYSQLKELQRNIANDVTPSRTTTDILANLKLLGQVGEMAGGANKDSLAKIASEEMKYLNAAMYAVTKNPILSEKFGSGLQGAMDVASLLKDRYTTKVYEEMLDSSLSKAIKEVGGTSFLTPEARVAKLNHGKGIE